MVGVTAVMMAVGRTVAIAVVMATVVFDDNHSGLRWWAQELS